MARMKISGTFGVALASAFCTFLATSNVAIAQTEIRSLDQAAQPDPVNRMIVKLRGDDGTVPSKAAASAARLSKVAGVMLVPYRPMSGAAQVLSLPSTMAYADVDKIAKKLMKMPDVVYAQPDAIYHLHQWPSDPLFDQTASPPGQFGLFAPPSAPVTQPRSAAGANMGDAWDVTTGVGWRSVVAVIDTGILQHADLAGQILPGYDMVTDPTNPDGDGRESDPSDPGDGAPGRTSSWHGTRVSGLIGAVANNGIGIAGVNWNARILPLRACWGDATRAPQCAQDDVIDGMRWAAGLTVPGIANNPPINKARVINLSLGAFPVVSCSPAYQSAVNDVMARKVIVVASSGNDHVDNDYTEPANCAGVISVTSIGHFGHRASYANVGAKVAIAAAGGESNSSTPKLIVSTGDTGLTTPNNSNTYMSGQGTSFSAPLVSGVISLMRSITCRPLKPSDITSILKLSARPFASTSTCANGVQFPAGHCGAGILDGGGAVNMAKTKFGYCPPGSGGGPVKETDIPASPN